MATLAVVVAGRAPPSVVRALFARDAGELWSLRTPYYDVDVRLHVVHAAQSLAADALPTHHALLVIYDPRDATGWSVARGVLEWASACTEDRPALLLAEEGAGEEQAWVLAENEVNRVALDAGFEFVVSRPDSTAAPAGGGEAKEAVPFGEAEGRARVLEALAAHRWPGLVPVQRRRPAANKEPAAAAAASAPLVTPNPVAVTPNPAAVSPSPVAVTPSPAPVSSSAPSTSSAPSASAVLASVAAEELLGAAGSGAVMASVRERLDRAAAADLGDGPDDDDEQDLSVLLKEMLALRAHAAQLPDAERRALAASVALYFAEKLGPDQ